MHSSVSWQLGQGGSQRASRGVLCLQKSIAFVNMTHSPCYRQCSKCMRGVLSPVLRGVLPPKLGGLNGRAPVVKHKLTGYSLTVSRKSIVIE